MIAGAKEVVMGVVVMVGVVVRAVLYDLPLTLHLSLHLDNGRLGWLAKEVEVVVLYISLFNSLSLSLSY